LKSHVFLKETSQYSPLFNKTQLIFDQSKLFERDKGLISSANAFSRTQDERLFWLTVFGKPETNLAKSAQF